MKIKFFFKKYIEYKCKTNKKRQRDTNDDITTCFKKLKIISNKKNYILNDNNLLILYGFI
jgi:hypothetical protein